MSETTPPNLDLEDLKTLSSATDLEIRRAYREQAVVERAKGVVVAPFGEHAVNEAEDSL
jgi:hypothetical protein